MRRSCSRPGCATEARATFSYEYASSTVWLDPLTPEAHPATYDLCAAHADRLAPPRGWQLADRRGDASPAVGTTPGHVQTLGHRVAMGLGAVAS